MKVETRVFGKTPKGEEITLYSISNDKGMRAEVINYGAILVNLFVPDKKGELVDVVLGFDTLEQYEVNPSFFGATIGPNANRIGGASYEIDGVRYQLDVNDGPNNLHTHIDLGYHKVVWGAKVNDNGVTFTYQDTDGNLGFPGNRKFSVTYSLDNENKLTLHYEGSSDVKTLMNFTNHTYFNLKGHDAGTITDHVLTLNASRYTPVVKGAIPTGELATVEGTPMNFLNPTEISKRIDDKFEQLLFNTLKISITGFVAGFPAPIILALFMNQLRGARFKKILQTVVYMPHFISLVVMVSMINIFINPNSGIYGLICDLLEVKGVNLASKPAAFVPVYIISDLWQHTGWNSIIYLAALSSVDPALHESAMIDGASKMKRILYIDIPSILPTVIIMMILSIGGIMSVGMDKAFLMQNPLNLSASEIISTYVYKVGMQSGQQSMSTAVGLFNNVVNFTLLITVNKISAKVSETSLW